MLPWPTAEISTQYHYRPRTWYDGKVLLSVCLAYYLGGGYPLLLTRSCPCSVQGDGYTPSPGVVKTRGYSPRQYLGYPPGQGQKVPSFGGQATPWAVPSCGYAGDFIVLKSQSRHAKVL